LQNGTFRSLRLSARFLRQAQISVLEIFNIFLWLKFSLSLNSNKNYNFSKASLFYALEFKDYPNIENDGTFLFQYTEANRNLILSAFR